MAELTNNQIVREINAAVRREKYVYASTLQHDWSRVIRAKCVKGTIHLLDLQSGLWCQLMPSRNYSII
jgi:hypothetical protein